ncbi:uncharacterized protein KY384_003337 [Bacidia gigantensis]|uniref:uncharacterized protein n=1 Tax=Bacidia gigantensis TaxID=2732470 RepID=UPI001D052CC1|nr:uncharacterized protein KY384_003337 [Bacidia gigantensis]KAG8531705.1 hypothetical protein KY384_003337 [Bacidia gigantensis]
MPSESIRSLITNLRLLDLDNQDDWSIVSPQALMSKDAGPNQKARIQAAEWCLYHLFKIWDPEETSNKLQPFFPSLEPLQSANLRAALFRCLNKLKLEGALPKETILRKSSFDDCKGEKFIELLFAFSTLVLRKVVSERAEGRDSIVRDVCCNQSLSSSDHRSFLPLATAHRSALNRILLRKAELKERYCHFGKVLDVKDRELDRRFENIVTTQSFLDENIAGEATVARVAKQFEQQWQGNQGYIDALTTDEKSFAKDSLLDETFETLWPGIHDGALTPDLSVDSSGLLENLAKRVWAQNERVQKWQTLKAGMQTNAKPTSPLRPQDSSPSRTRTTIGDRRRGKDLVFSPRKSPRKSEFPLAFAPSSPQATMSPVQSLEYSPLQAHSISDAGAHTFGTPKDFLKRRDSRIDSIFNGPNETSHNDLSFSELNQDDRTKLGIPRSSPSNSFGSPRNQEPSPSEIQKPFAAKEAALQSPPSSLLEVQQPNIDRRFGTDRIEEEDETANLIDPQPFNAAPTPVKPALSLLERTRQSMAFATPSTRLAANDSPPTMAPPPRPTIPQIEENSSLAPRANLVERTRQSISLLPPKIKPQRRSLNNRRDSKTYPVNQFETPHKALSRELTPPQEIFSPGAGYDSVFKSRPKIGHSPSATPEPTSGEDGMIDAASLRGGDGLQTSPLARLTSQVR